MREHHGRLSAREALAARVHADSRILLRYKLLRRPCFFAFTLAAFDGAPVAKGPFVEVGTRSSDPTGVVKWTRQNTQRTMQEQG